MNPVLTNVDWAELRVLLEDVAKLTNGRGIPHPVASRAGHFLPKLALRAHALHVRRTAALVRRGESKSARKKRIRKTVRERDRECTAKGLIIDGALIRCLGALTMDHQWGVGKVEETIENCRILCARHHQLRQEENPSRIFWIAHFKAHCERHGYVDEVAKCDRLLALERAQHPSSSAPRRGVAPSQT